MQERTLARRYARGLFEEARQRHELDQVEQELRLLGPVLSMPNVARFFNNPCVNPEQKRNLIQSALGPRSSTSLINLLLLMAQRRRLKAFPYVVQIFEELLDDFRRLARVKIKLAAPTSEANLAAFKAKLSSALGRNVELEPEVDESLIGGGMLVIKDTILDGSVKGAIERLREKMRQ